MLSRRKLIGSLISLVAAPAIVRVSSIMPVKAMEPSRLAIIYGGQSMIVPIRFSIVGITEIQDRYDDFVCYEFLEWEEAVWTIRTSKT